mmetsp:Transcript_51749/g.118901  ORF Transcript_51749/g.118901 Transcript_51749/m.118901 type:complete len:214 (-) Transcript_51749:221-862(-)
MCSTEPISASMRSTASLAPPCAGPHREAIPAAMHAKGLACDEEAMRTVDVLAFCSWSAWRMKIFSSAAACTWLTLYGSRGVANIMCRKLCAKPRAEHGYTTGWPMAVLYAIAAIVGIFAMRRMAESRRWAESCMLVESGKKAEREPTTPTMMAIGCASDLKPEKKVISFSCTIACCWSSASKAASCRGVGSSPSTSRYATSGKEALAASSSIG